MGKIALVTGGSRGIGAATCQLLAENGYDVAINFCSDRTAAEKMADAVQRQGGRSIARDLTLRGVQCILTEQKDVNAGAPGANHELLHSGARYVSADPAGEPARVTLNTVFCSRQP